MKGPSTAFGRLPPLQMQGRMFGAAAAELSGAVAMLLGWRPAAFWEATPAELALALAPPSAPIDPNEFEDLKRRFPDD